jgi:hypothetical protein
MDVFTPSLRTVDRNDINDVKKINPVLGHFAEKYISAVNVESDEQIAKIETERNRKIDDYLVSTSKYYTQLYKKITKILRNGGVNSFYIVSDGVHCDPAIRPSVDIWSKSNPGAYAAVLAIKTELNRNGWSVNLRISDYRYNPEYHGYEGGNNLILRCKR